MLLNATPLIEKPIQAISVLDQPGIVLPTNLRVQARNTIHRYLDIIAREASQSEDRLIELPVADELPIDLNEHASMLPCRPTLRWHVSVGLSPLPLMLSVPSYRCHRRRRNVTGHN